MKTVNSILKFGVGTLFVLTMTAGPLPVEAQKEESPPPVAAEQPAPAPDVQERGLPGQPLGSPTFSKMVDPCVMASAQILQPLLQSELTDQFPVTGGQPGNKVTLKDPTLLSATCALPLRIEVRLKVSYKKTRGFPQFSSSGDMRFGAPLTGRVFYTGTKRDPVTAANFQHAWACLTDITVLGLNIRNVPNWIDNTFVRGLLNNELIGQEDCFNITNLVRQYLQSGHTL